MAPLGPFEAAPHVAVGLSGGPDSMALALLLHDWAQRRGGSLLAITVDHGLRQASGAEAEQVAAWMGFHGILHVIRRWEGAKPVTGLQEAARGARYDLLEQECRERGILHLALGHQQEDQAETVLIRRGMRSGPDGLAAMPSIRERPGLRLIRPVLDVPRARLEATCDARRQPFIRDPSNRDTRFARGRLRATEPVDPVPALAEAARQAGCRRADRDDLLAQMLARHGAFHPEGWIELDAAVFRVLDDEDSLGLLSRLTGAVGGRPYPPRGERMERLLTRLREGAGEFSGGSLGGCLFSRAGAVLRIVREPASVEAPIVVAPGGTAVWDRRFRLEWNGSRTVTLGALEAEGWAKISSDPIVRVGRVLPASVRRTLPAIRGGQTLLLVPHLNYVRLGSGCLGYRLGPEAPVPAAGARFSVVMPAREII